MAPDTAVSMRHTKIKAEEAALLAGELKKPSWQSKNEGIHERVSFEDSIWGFDLAGGAYYKTPLRVTFVKPDSRAEKAGIRPGDKLLRINDIDTSTLTIQEAHEIIIESGIHLKLAVTAPEDEEDSYYCYEDQIEEGYDSEEERRKEEERARKRQVHARVSSYWSLQWPWVSKRRVIYRESNCFMVPSKYEEKHRDKFSPQPMIRTQDDIVLESINSEISKKRQLARGVKNETANLKSDSAQINTKNNDVSNLNGKKSNEVIKDSNKLGYISEVEEDSINEDSTVSQVNESSVSNDDLESSSKIDEPEQPSEEAVNKSDDEVGDDANHEAPEIEGESNKEESSISELDSTIEETSHSKEDEANSKNDKISSDDEVIGEVLGNKDDDVSKDDEEKILNGIIGDGEHGESNNER